jgi:glutathione gamma-glutamylcysteinyltransferase
MSTNPLLGTFHRRTLPLPSIAFSSTEGKAIFTKALIEGGLENYFPISEAFQSQGHPAFCGLGSLTVALNAILLDPQRIWQGVWRWFDESMLTCCDPLDQIKLKGISLSKLNCLAVCQGAETEIKFACDISEDTFRDDVKKICCKTVGSSLETETGNVTIPNINDNDNNNKPTCKVLIASYSRSVLKQSGSGHFSPIGGYCAELDLVLIMDVARFKYPPHWVPLSLLYQAMCSVDDESGISRGYITVGLSKSSANRLYESWSCHDDDDGDDGDGSNLEEGKEMSAQKKKRKTDTESNKNKDSTAPTTATSENVHSIVSEIYKPSHSCSACSSVTRLLHSEI